MSVVVQVFGRRYDEPFHALWRPASKKRQGTKSREVGHRRCSGRFGDFVAAAGSGGGGAPTGCRRRGFTLARSATVYMELRQQLEHVNRRTRRAPRWARR